ncbi:regulatory protein GntR HTH [Gemmatirosa kalamazoonensis]|uniref:Regulatory protein GntR HTH n=1 Tax=Gemmatirosa kalamazoonensis TaxID=861299 RepID=W0RD75_9BACT|nr:GntR family transcriptional regulator [Gemmatirosa kalamazoonensis]AHG88726.1 regulatory protein GntR HTH [Gemmatirosa kalamazoonensis]
MSIDPGASTPLYQQVAADIRRQIVSGAIPVGTQLQPHRELAATYGVSVITINKALSGLVAEGVLHSRVGRGTFVAVRPAPTDLPGAPAPKNGTAGAGRMLGFVLRDLSSPFFSLVAHAAQQRADAVGYGLLLASSSNRLDREEEQIRRLLGLGVQGLIVVSMSRTYRLSDTLRSLHDADFPYVMVSYTEGEDVPFVGTDYARVGRLAAEHLYALGRRRIGYICDKFGSAAGELRGRGYREVLQERGLSVDPAFQYQYPLEGEWNDYESGYAIGEHVARLTRRPDAMFAFNDLGALGFEDALLDHGVRVPDDIALVGLDDIELAGRARVPLTTVRQPADRIGALAVDTLLARLAGQRPPAHQLLDPELVVRRSCGASPSAADPNPDAGGARAEARRALAAQRRS